MQTSFDSDVLKRAVFLIGDVNRARCLSAVPPRAAFDEEVLDFLNSLSGIILNSREAKAYSDLVTFAFWIRRASTRKLKERFERTDSDIRLGRGAVFHIAPSNVPVNFAYSLAAGLLCGNANIVRLPGKEFAQIRILADAICRALESYSGMMPYICLVRYGHDRGINDYLSNTADVRVVWGGDQTIAELRKSPLSPRGGEITFADRYSIAVIDSQTYLEQKDKQRIAEGFYNDTYFSDQNACTSPRLIVWLGTEIEEAKRVFWEYEHGIVKKKYPFQSIQGINKLIWGSLVAAVEPGVQVEPREDNLVFRVRVSRITEKLMEQRVNSGFFYEYDCNNIKDIAPLCNDKRCQTIAYIGSKEMLSPLLQLGVKGVDRIVPIGKTMDFDLIWDGYELPAILTRTIQIL